jgi:DNA-binding response OmpR family regulator
MDDDRTRLWGEGVSVAVLDDDPRICRLLERVFEASGCYTETFATGAEALAALNTLLARPGHMVLVTDLYLENETGVEVLQKVRDHFPSLPVILMSGGGEREHLIEAMRLHCSGFLEKPFTPKGAVNAVRAAIPRTNPDLDESSSSATPLPDPDERYVLEEVLATGGMGIVYRARQRDLDRLVALKVLRTDLHISAEAREGLVREARLMAQLRHPNVAIVHEVGRLRGMDFYSMELVEGQTLADLLRDKGRIAPEEAVRLLLPIADGLACAHELGILHRDVKPTNIVIDASNRPVLVDFGVALKKDDKESSAERRGTLQYMAPEYLDGMSFDEGCDAYSLGTTLYEALAGYRITPLLGDGPRGYDDTLLAIARGDLVPIERFRPDLDPALSAILSRTLAPREERIAVRELARELEQWLARQVPATDES